MRALVTGSAGFVGRFLVDLLRSSGDEVVESDRSSGGPDICDRTAVSELLAATPCDVVYHLAGQSHVPTSWDNPIGTLRANVEGTQNVLDAARDAGCERVVVVSSADIYGVVASSDQPIAESHPLRPVSPYAASKVGAEAVAQQAGLGHGQDVIRVRAFNHIGPGQRTDFAVSGLAARIADAANRGSDSLAVGNLDPRRDFTDVRDVVAAYRLIAERGVAGDAYNVCSGMSRSIREVAATLMEIADVDLTLVQDQSLSRPVDVPEMRGDNRKLIADTGWAPTIDFRQSLVDIYEDAKARLDV